jgi:hypothetical protein
VTHRWVHDLELKFVVEPTRDEHIHACTPDDIVHLLSLLPKECVNGADYIEGIVLRQATHKQERLQPVWGRLVYYAEVGAIRGPAIYIESQMPWLYWSFPRKQTLEEQGEFERMQHLAGGYETDRRRHWFRWEVLNLRRWLLYHTLIHEVGHWVHYLSKVVVPEKNGEGDFDQLWDRYHQHPSSEQESFAHRFSDEWRDELVRRSMLPFARHFDEDKLRAEGLDPEWFRSPSRDQDEAGAPIPLTLKQRRKPITVPPLRG